MLSKIFCLLWNLSIPSFLIWSAILDKLKYSRISVITPVTPVSSFSRCLSTCQKFKIHHQFFLEILQTYSEPSQTSKIGLFAKMVWKKLHFRCFTEFWVRFWILLMKELCNLVGWDWYINKEFQTLSMVWNVLLWF